MDQIEINPSGPIHASIRPPGSKSITNRAFLCAALARGPSRLTGVLDSDDTRYMLDGLRQLGIQANLTAEEPIAEIEGCGGKLPTDHADLFIGNSGTTIRFLTAAVGIGHGRFRLDGVKRMRARPIQDLLDALQQLGVAAKSEEGTGAPPVVVEAQGMRGGVATVVGNISSQFVSGLLMASPYALSDVTLKIQGELVSQPYVDMTLAVMHSFGVSTTRQGSDYFIPAQQCYVGRDYEVEPDASAASYFWAAAAITGGKVTVKGLTSQALQGDVRFCQCLRHMGCTVHETSTGITVTGHPLKGIDVNMNQISDTVQTLSAVALFAEGPTTIRGVAHNRHKETDRIGDLARELRRLGATVLEAEDGMTIVPGQLKPAVCETYDDHRMAMSLALVGLKQPGVVIREPGCTSKTYPSFFEDLARVTR